MRRFSPTRRDHNLVSLKTDKLQGQCLQFEAKKSTQALTVKLVDFSKKFSKPLSSKTHLILLSCFINYACRQLICFLNRIMLRNMLAAVRCVAGYLKICPSVERAKSWLYPLLLIQSMM